MGLLAKSKGKGGGMKTRRGKCNNCGEAGHWAHDCTKPKKKNNANGSAQGSTQAPVGHMFTAVNAKAAGYKGTTTYYLDSGASNHYTPCREDLQDYAPFSAPHMINTAKGQVQAIGAGTVRYTIQLKDGTEGFGELRDVTWVPGISARLLSVCQLAGSGYTAAFKQSGCELHGPGGNTINILVVQQVYPVQLRIKSMHTNGTANLMFTECNNMQLAKRLDDEWLMTAMARTEITWLDLHRMMGHLNLCDCKRLTKGAARNVRVTNVSAPLPTHSDCIACIEGKQTRLPFSPGWHRAEGLLDLVHMDTVGPMETQSYDGKKYALTLVDDKSHVCTMEPMTHQDQTLDAFKCWKTAVENSCQRKIRAIMCDNAKEFVQGRFKAYLDAEGIQLYTSVPHSPQMNGVAERMNQTIVEGALSGFLHYFPLFYLMFAYLLM